MEKSEMENCVIDVVIPVYKPEKKFVELIRRLQLQRLKIRNIILMHTKDGNDLMHSECLTGYDNIIIREIEPEEFDHGGTRDEGIRISNADYVLCMTQDAVPADSCLTKRLLDCMEDEQMAVAYARQLPDQECSLLERYIRQFNYPKDSLVKTRADLETMGIKTYFCSNVCALYRRSLYDKLGGFEKRTIFNEDMIFAAVCIQNGYKIAYEADARVIHSHNYTNRQQFRRNFDLAVSQAQHPEIFEGVRSESEGIRMVKSMAAYLIRKHRPFMIIRLVTSSAAKYAGYFLGKRYLALPRAIVAMCTMSPRYWANSKK